MVFKNPICSLPEVGGCWGRGEGSVSTVTWHWREITVSQEVRTWLFTQHSAPAGEGTRNPRSLSLSGGELGSYGRFLAPEALDQKGLGQPALSHIAGVSAAAGTMNPSEPQCYPPQYGDQSVSIVMQ